MPFGTRGYRGDQEGIVGFHFRMIDDIDLV